MAGEAPAQLEQVLGCDLDDAFTVLAGRAARRKGTSWEWRADSEPAADRNPLDAPYPKPAPRRVQRPLVSVWKALRRAARELRPGHCGH